MEVDLSFENPEYDKVLVINANLSASSNFIDLTVLYKKKHEIKFSVNRSQLWKALKEVRLIESLESKATKGAPRGNYTQLHDTFFGKRKKNFTNCIMGDKLVRMIREVEQLYYLSYLFKNAND